MRRVVRRLGELDFPDRVSSVFPVWAAQILFAAICTIAPIFVRWLVDLFAPDAGPFSLVYPAVMVATLFGRWQAGLITLVASILYAWYAVLPAPDSFAFEIEGDGARTFVNFVSMLAILVLSEIFRRAVRRAVEDRHRQIESRDLMLREFDHRVRNNFASVTGLLQFQIQRAENGETADALATAIGRVESIARANRYLFVPGADVDRTYMPDYLSGLCSTLEQVLLEGKDIELRCTSAQATIETDQAVAVGLLINELVTNAVKHAFADHGGSIAVRFDAIESGYRLSVEDDGQGIQGEARPQSLGRKLMDAFAKQLGGAFETRSGPEGTLVTLEFSKS